MRHLALNLLTLSATAALLVALALPARDLMRARSASTSIPGTSTTGHATSGRCCSWWRIRSLLAHAAARAVPDRGAAPGHPGAARVLGAVAPAACRTRTSGA